MTTFDWLLLLVLLASIGLGIQRGWVYESLSVFFWLLVFYLALLLAPDLASLLSLRYGTEKELYAVSFLLIFIASTLIGALYAVSLSNGAKVPRTGRALSGALGLLRGVILLLAATVVISMTGLKSRYWWRDSNGADVLMTTFKGIKPMLPQRVARRIN